MVGGNLANAFYDELYSPPIIRDRSEGWRDHYFQWFSSVNAASIAGSTFGGPAAAGVTDKEEGAQPAPDKASAASDAKRRLALLLAVILAAAVQSAADWAHASLVRRPADGATVAEAR